MNEQKKNKKPSENHYVKPHNVVSRDCKPEDTDRIMQDGLLMYEMCTNPPEKHGMAFAIAHSQINDKEPLRFFVNDKGDVIINPVITRHTKHEVMKPEACTTWPEWKPGKQMPRWHKIEVTYYTIEDEDTLEWVKVEKGLKGIEAHIFQHEIDHMNAKYIHEDEK